MPTSARKFVVDGKSTYMPKVGIEELAKNAGQDLVLNLRAEKLDKRDSGFLGFGGKGSDPFLVISRPSREGGLVPIVQTEVVPKNLNPTWQPLRLHLDALCRGDLDNVLNSAHANDTRK
ncbi:hypothetical protein DFJ74DRAFT_709517 [Hyaloraphidium curvatum]|nr:hypothetical protein DFJ74DRAFT_709517 [Hyaloraphidium curvatum]